MVTAFVLIAVQQGQIAEVAQALIALPGITEAYSVAGPHDLVAIARVREHEELDELITRNLQRIPGITGTQTLIAFRAYSSRDLEALWEIGFEESTE
jgi:DNA-binding Lrp family transcriptional regulator